MTCLSVELIRLNIVNLPLGLLTTRLQRECRSNLRLCLQTEK
jgi:hypothetical protein